MKYKQLFTFVLVSAFVGMNASDNRSQSWSEFFDEALSFREGDRREVASHDINFPYGNGWTRLHSAAMLGKTLKVKEYLDNPKVNVKVQDDDKKTAMHHAMQNGNVSIIVLLRRSKAGFGYRDNNGNHPLDYASEETLFRLRKLKIIDQYLK